MLPQTELFARTVNVFSLLLLRSRKSFTLRSRSLSTWRSSWQTKDMTGLVWAFCTRGCWLVLCNPQILSRRLTISPRIDWTRNYNSAACLFAFFLLFMLFFGFWNDLICGNVFSRLRNPSGQSFLGLIESFNDLRFFPGQWYGLLGCQIRNLPREHWQTISSIWILRTAILR